MNSNRVNKPSPIYFFFDPQCEVTEEEMDELVQYCLQHGLSEIVRQFENFPRLFPDEESGMPDILLSNIDFLSPGLQRHFRLLQPGEKVSFYKEP
jgi:hypothetical protein